MVDKLKFLKGKVKEYIKFNIIGISNFIVSQIFYITLFFNFCNQKKDFLVLFIFAVFYQFIYIYCR